MLPSNHLPDVLQEGVGGGGQRCAGEGCSPLDLCTQHAPPSAQLEDLEVTIADHIQKVMKLNFEAAWDEVGDEFEKEETFTLSTIKTLEGKSWQCFTWLTCFQRPLALVKGLLFPRLCPYAPEIQGRV